MRKIIHIDMDCFYAAVEEKHDPTLKGKPMAVGGPPQSRSVICTANYEARKYGVKAAIPSSRAVKLCPSLIIRPPRFSLYREESRNVRKILERFTDIIEPLSLDEAYLDVTDCKLFGGSATLIAKEIRQQIYNETQLTASAGIAPNKFLAKVASDWRKPNGQFVITPEHVSEFVQKLPVDRIFGVGKVTAQSMHLQGCFTCADLQRLSLFQLEKFWGSRAHSLYDLCRGVDSRPVQTRHIRKSWSVEETLENDLHKWEDLRQNLEELYLSWARQCRHRTDLKIKSLFVKVRTSDFQRHTKETRFQDFPQFSDFEKLFVALREAHPEPLRLIGLGVRLHDTEDTVCEDQQQLSFLKAFTA